MNRQIEAALSDDHANRPGVLDESPRLGDDRGAFLKPVGVLIVVYLLIRFGMPNLAQLLRPKG
ncbi:MAG TPA: hypothetical protein VF503_14855 [Sphingobium sp.]|uniref:hypothetical protein n=1 Tax=Sphingobium sp. TaxID=1912891 RepID=UPI002ED3812B